MTFFKLSMAAALLTAIAAPAFANNSDDAFNSFKTVCGGTAAEYADVVAASQSDGWKVAQVQGTNAMPGVSVTDKATRSKSVSESALMLFASRGLAQISGSAYTVSTCTVSSDRGDLPTLTARAQGWLGFAPHGTTSDSATFRFTMAGGAPTAVADGDINAAAAAAGLETLTIKRTGSKLTLDLVKFKK